MYSKIITSILLLASLSMSSIVFCQVSFSPAPASASTRGIARQEGLKFPDYPVLELPDHYHHKQLPAAADNSVLPFMRPVFRQQGASCGQAAGVAYNFCYEINRARNLPADTSIHQYPSHFTWNFMNAGDYYGVGVSYFHSFEILRAMGCPNEATFGPITMDNPYLWMSGYEKYLHAMHNRIREAHSIPVGTTRGLLTLKNWLNDHLDGSSTGGLANIYLGNNPAVLLPPGTPEAGKFVVSEWLFPATHAMTIVGYNDSIRLDVNGDGLYTNHLDINNDGKVDMKDWEIGGVKLVNSYGTDYCNNGYTYALYRSLALDYGMGGVWNNAAHIIMVEPGYQPLLTLRTAISHEKRGRIRIRVGVNPDTTASMPSTILEFPVFNYQGGDYYLKGGYSESDKTLELGLDITPLASELGEDQNARFFLLIDEQDQESIGMGNILQFSVISYNGTTEAFECSETPFSITGNGSTMVSVVVHTDFPDISISPDYLPAPVIGQPYSQQLLAMTAQAPYSWELKKDYSLVRLPETSASPTGQKIPLPFSDERIIPLFLPFSFPFYGETYDTLFIHTDGYLLTELFNAPYPYIQDEALYLSQIRTIAPFMNQFQEIASTQQGVWIAADSSLVEVTWVLGTEESTGMNNFKVRLFPDGKIEFHYGIMAAGSDGTAAYGISNGDGLNKQVFRSRDQAANGSIQLEPVNLPASLHLDDNGLLSCDTITAELCAEFEVILSDARHIRKTKKYTLCTGPVAELEARAGNDRFIEAGEEAVFSLKLVNNSGEALENLHYQLHSTSTYITPLDSAEWISALAPGEVRIIENAFRYKVTDTFTGTLDIPFRLQLEWNGRLIEQTLNFPAYHFEYAVSGPLFLDQHNNFPDPGDSGKLLIRFSNGLKKPEALFSAILTSGDPYLLLQGDSPTALTANGSGNYLQGSWDVEILPKTPGGHQATFMVRIFEEGQDTLFKDLNLLIGQPNVLVIDKDKNHNSAVHIAASIRNLGLLPKQQPVIDSTIFNFRTIFLSLGIKPYMTLLNTAENDLLDAFMEQGGNLYLESGLHFSLQTSFSAIRKFSVQTGYTAWQYKPDTLLGIESAFTEGMKFHYFGDSLNITELSPKDSAFSLFRDKNSALNFTVAHETQDYRTIASSIEFGGIFPFGSTTREDIMSSYLDFFGIDPEPLVANFSSSEYMPCVEEWVTFIPKIGAEPLTYHWTFSGGEPAVSSEPIGRTKWNNAGLFDVSLVVTGNNTSDTLTLEEIVNVQDCNSIDETAVQAPFRVYPNPSGGSGVIRILCDLKENISIRLQNMQGQIVQESRIAGSDEIRLQLNGMPAGLYLLKITGEHRTFTEKLIIK